MARKVIMAALAVAVLLALAGCMHPAAPAAPASRVPASRAAVPRRRPPLSPAPAPARPLVGVYEPGAPASWSGVAAFTAATGVRPRIVVYYSSWGDPFAASFARRAWREGAYVLVQLQPEGVSLASIAAGRSDAYLRSYADAVAAFGHPVIVAFGHEMNGSWYPWGYGRTPAATFVAAWRHVVSVFRAQGAGNATWLWAVNAVSGASGDLRQWWPGAAWVNWAGIDGYYFTGADTFGSVFGATIAAVRAITGDPLLISETAVGTTADRDSQISNLFAGVREQHLAGLVWFDQAQRAGLYHQDWRLENDPAALAAFAAAAALLARTRAAEPPARNV